MALANLPLAFSLPVWLERLLGVAPAAGGEGIRWGWSATWVLPPWLTLLLAVGIVALVGWLYFRESRSVGLRYAMLLAALRLAAVAVVAFMLSQVVLTRERTGLPYVAVLLDRSASMSHVDERSADSASHELAERLKAAELNEATRLNLARLLLLERDAAVLREIEQRYKLKLYFFDRTLSAQTGDIGELVQAVRDLKQATGDATQLGAAIRGVINDLRGSPPSAIIVITDGINTSGESLADAAEFAQRKKVPLYTVAVGGSAPLRNIRLSDLLADDVVFVDDVAYFEFQLTGSGLADKRVEVMLTEKGQTRILAKTTVPIHPEGRPQRVRLPYRPTKAQYEQRARPGEDFVEYEFVVKAEPLPEEGQRVEDNVLPPKKIKVSQKKIRVLLAQSAPSHEFRFLKNLLEREPTIELKTVLQDADPQFASIDRTSLPEFPVRRDALLEFDLLILGDIDPRLFSPLVMTNIVNFVKEQGRSVIFVAGPRYMPRRFADTPLAALFPFNPAAVTSPPAELDLKEGFTVQPTELGFATPNMQLGDTPGEAEMIWRNFPEMYWLLEVDSLKPSARVLAEHSTRTSSAGRKLPVFIEHYLNGKVLFHCVDETYRWRFRVGDVFLSRYWVQTIRYLCRSKLLGDSRAAELTADRRQYQRGEPIRLRVRFQDERSAPAEDDGVTVMLEREGATPQRQKLQRHATSRGVFEGVVNNAAEGNYHAWIVTPAMTGGAGTFDFSVDPPPGEMQRLQTDEAELKRAAAITGGKFYTVDAAGRLTRDLPEGRQVVLESLEPFVIWNWFPVPLAVVMLLIAEWLLRKRKGLL